MSSEAKGKIMKFKGLRPSGTSFNWCINTYNGCEHGCLYCYGRGVRKKSTSDWVNKVAPIKNIIANLNHDMALIKNDLTLAKNIKDIMICSVTDSYQPVEEEYGLTQQAIKMLVANALPFTVITKNKLVLRDISLFKGYNKCRVGFTIVTLDEILRQQVEPGTSTIDERIDALKTLKANGISTYCSVEPILPCEASDPIAIVKELTGTVDLFEFGMWTPRDKKHLPQLRYDEPYLIRKMRKATGYCKSSNIKYCTAGHSRDRLKAHRVKHTPCPTVIL